MRFIISNEQVCKQQLRVGIAVNRLYQVIGYYVLVQTVANEHSYLKNIKDHIVLSKFSV